MADPALTLSTEMQNTTPSTGKNLGMEIPKVARNISDVHANPSESINNPSEEALISEAAEANNVTKEQQQVHSSLLHEISELKAEIATMKDQLILILRENLEIAKQGLPASHGNFYKDCTLNNTYNLRPVLHVPQDYDAQPAAPQVDENDEEKSWWDDRRCRLAVRVVGGVVAMYLLSSKGPSIASHVTRSLEERIGNFISNQLAKALHLRFDGTSAFQLAAGNPIV